MSLIIYMSSPAEQLGIASEFTFSWGGPKLARGTSFGCQNWSGGTDFGGRPIFLLQDHK